MDGKSGWKRGIEVKGLRNHEKKHNREEGTKRVQHKKRNQGME